MTTQILNVADLVAGTLAHLGPNTFQQVAQSLQDYEIFPKWFKKDKVMLDSGSQIQRNLMVNLPDAARHVGWTETDNPDITDLMKQMQVPWRHAKTDWSFKRQEALINRGAALVFNVIKPRREGAMINLIEQLEEKGWSTPASDSDDKVPWGIPYWVVKNSGTPGFNGGAAYGSTVAGINVSTYTNFKNWTGQYTANSKADLVKKMRTMHRKVRFKSPISQKDYRSGMGERYRVYVNETTFSGFEDIGESQNENLGRDIAAIDGFDMAFRRNPIRWVPSLDADTSQPVYFVDHSTFYPVCLKGDYLNESPPIRDPLKHDWHTIYIDLTYNYLCVDRRRNGVLYI